MAVKPADTVPSLEGPEAQLLWDAAAAEQAYWTTRYDELLRVYPEQFVAVVDGRVVATSGDLQELLAVLARNQIEPTQVWVRFITADPHRLTP